MNSDDREAFTVNEFSKKIGVLPATIRKWLNTGELRGTRIGRKWLIPLSELERIKDPIPKKQP